MTEGYHHRRSGKSVVWEGWLLRAACAQGWVDPDIFFPELTSAEKKWINQYGGFAASERKAKAVCARCPVRAECLTLMYESGQKQGVWGGTLPRERNRQQIRHADTCNLRCGVKRGCRPVQDRVRVLLEEMEEQAVKNGFRERRTA